MDIKLNELEVGLGGGSLLQIANRSLRQMMSYLIETPNGKVIMIDGGAYCAEDGQYLYEQLMLRGGRVSLWFLTHAHSDHLGALKWILENYPEGSIRIDYICFHFPPKDWLAKMEEADNNMQFLELIQNCHINTVTVRAGEILSCDQIAVEVLNNPIVHDEFPTINPTGIMLLVNFPQRDVLFLGDFDVYGQTEFLEKYDVSKIRKDIVQMAHHGQRGVDRSFYELIHPKICLYTTPIWLWENNEYMCLDPETNGKGPFTTLETRQWMEQLGVQASCVQAFGDYRLF